MENKKKSLLLYLFLFTCLISCSDKPETNDDESSAKYNFNDYDNIVLYKYKGEKLINKVQKYSVGINDASITVSEYKYNKFDSLSKVSQISKSEILGVIDSSKHFYLYNEENKLELEYEIGAEGDTNLIIRSIYLPNYQDSLHIIKRKVFWRNDYAENDLAVSQYDVVEIYNLKNLVKNFSIESNQDTSIFEYNQFNEMNDIIFNYALGIQGDTLRVRNYNYKRGKIDNITGFIDGVQKYFTEYYDDYARIKKSVVVNYNNDTIVYYYNYNKDGLLEATYWNNK